MRVAAASTVTLWTRYDSTSPVAGGSGRATMQDDEDAEGEQHPQLQRRGTAARTPDPALSSHVLSPGWSATLAGRLGGRHRQPARPGFSRRGTTSPGRPLGRRRRPGRGAPGPCVRPLWQPPSMRSHSYDVTTVWTGNTGSGTSGYRDYARSLEVSAPGRETLPGSSDPAFRGDPTRWNPELLLLAALGECHLLSYLHVCVEAGVVVTAYRDEAAGTMVEDGAGGGRFTEVVLRPHVTVADASTVERATALHADASARCFIAASVGFPVRHEPVVVAEGTAPGCDA